MVVMEAAGLPSFLRDKHGEIMTLCNDGDVYCNVTTFDWTQPHVRALWVEQVLNITQTGLVWQRRRRFGPSESPMNFSAPCQPPACRSTCTLLDAHVVRCLQPGSPFHGCRRTASSPTTPRTRTSPSARRTRAKAPTSCATARVQASAAMTLQTSSAILSTRGTSGALTTPRTCSPSPPVVQCSRCLATRHHLDHFTGISQGHVVLHTPCGAVYLAHACRMLIGACNPTFWLFHASTPPAPHTHTV